MSVFIVCGVQGRMRPYAFVGVRSSQAAATDDARQYMLMHGKPGVVLKADAGRDGSVEVFRADYRKGSKLPTLDPRRRRTDPKRRVRARARRRVWRRR
jgi:hypothetical protein